MGRFAQPCIKEEVMLDLATVPTAQRGEAWVDGWNCVYADDVRSGDMVRADFDRTAVGTGGGLYLIEEWRDGEPVWRGCRRMVKGPDGIYIDQEGAGRWEQIELDQIGWKVVATVVSVNRPTHFQSGDGMGRHLNPREAQKQAAPQIRARRDEHLQAFFGTLIQK